MHVVKLENSLPIKYWTTDVPESSAWAQALNLSNLPFAFRHVALMPDCHAGYGMPIGGVLATKGVVIPNAVGVDIGCGMLATRTSLTEIDTETIKKIMGTIREVIPVGFAHRKLGVAWSGFDDAPDDNIVIQQLLPGTKQLGTLGGGNHFIEIQKGDDGHVWFMIHSGSRNVGYKIAHAYHEIAKKLCEQWQSDLPHKDLSFLPIESQEGKAYMRAMEFALKFAQKNRDVMAELVEDAFLIHTTCGFDESINIHHNYATWEHHFGKDVIVHRKGATSAREGQTGIIPGSMGTASYIVSGLGNPESFMSCSHGAGRRMGRAEAKRTLSLEGEQAKMDGIVHGLRTEGDLDEAPGAYKDIDTVMENQKDLVEIVVKMKPLGVIKG